MAKYRVLLVDDVNTILSLVRIFLSGLDIEFDTAVDGEEGLAKARSHPPDVVVADVKMPKKDGLELCADLKADPTLKQVRVILLSGQADDPAIQRRARLLGVDELLLKPVAPEKLRTAVRKALEAR